MSDGVTLKTVLCKARGDYLHYLSLVMMCLNMNICNGVCRTHLSRESVAPGSDGSKAILVVIPQNPYPTNEKKGRANIIGYERLGGKKVENLGVIT